MAFDHILTAFLHEPWGIRPEKHDAIGRALAPHLEGLPLPMAEEVRKKQNPNAHRNEEWKPCGTIVGPVDSESGEPLIPQMQKIGPLAIIPVFGTLGRHLSFLALWCGGCDYAYIEQMAQLAEADPNIDQVVFYFRSPGGMTAGCMECAEAIAAMRKETVAYSDDECASCAQILAAACDQFIAAPSAVIGSVGIFVAGRDDSEAWKTAGMKRELFRTGPLKATGISGKPWTEQERTAMQARVDEEFAVFATFLRAHRGQIAAEVFDGGWFYGRQGAALGLADGTANTIEQLLAALLSS